MHVSLQEAVYSLAHELEFPDFELLSFGLRRSDGVFFLHAALSRWELPCKYEKFNSKLHSLLGRFETSCKFDYPQNYDGFADIDAHSLVCAIAACTDDAQASLLKSAAVELDGGVLHITFGHEMAQSLFNLLGLSEIIKSYLCKYYGLSLNIDTCVDAGIAPAEPEKRPDTQVKATIPSAPKQMPRSNLPQQDAKAPRRSWERAPLVDEKGEGIVRGKRIKLAPAPISDILSGDIAPKNVAICGELVFIETKSVKNGEMVIVSFGIYDGTSTIFCKLFFKTAEADKYVKKLKVGERYILRGNVSMDNFQHELCMSPIDINNADRQIRSDNADEKRVELHLHTMMSMLDAPNDIGKCVERAVLWGHDAIAVTDHGVVQAFPDAERAAGKAKKAGRDIKIIYGMEAYLIDDTAKVYSGDERSAADTDFVVFDLETTGLNPRSDMITEIGAVKMRGGEIIDRFSSFVNPQTPIPMRIISLTGITDDMVADAPTIDAVLPEFFKFAGGAVLCAHNASFDMSFIVQQAKRLGLPVKNEVIDTLELSKRKYPHLQNHKLNTVADHLHLRLNHHRAQDDAECCAHILLDCMSGVDRLSQLNELLANNDAKSGQTYHAVLLAQNKTGLKNLYKLVSASHLQYYSKRPRIPKSLLSAHREGLILGSACEQGELFRAVMSGASKDKLDAICRFYDYYELQPKGNNAFLIRNGTLSGEAQLDVIYRRILELGRKYGKPVVATTDAHFLDPGDEYYRRILQGCQHYEDAEFQPPLYYRTTQEMLDEFAFLGEETAYEIVVTNTRAIADRIERFRLLPEETQMPSIEGAPEKLRELCYATTRERYGDPIPDIVQKRLDRELDAIIGHGYAVLYYIAHLLVAKSLSDGYLVGSRGSVGSSFAAYAAKITEVNPLPPHYLCEKCKYTDFDIDVVKYECGVDLPHRSCPNCGAQLLSTGYNIPFEVFLGINADKVPDIDLNFSSEYQSHAHAYTEEMFGKDHVFRAGTISSLQSRIAYGYVRKYSEESGHIIGNAETLRLSQGLTGVRKTTGQHPGGLVIVPKDQDIHDFSPVQHPANDMESSSVTTHFAFDSLHDTLIKLDILGHDDPTMLRMLARLTGIDPLTVPLDDPETMSLFTSTTALGVTPDDLLGCKNGAIALPEFGTKFVRGMLNDTNPTTMSELLRISGLSHGTNLWLNNAQDLIREGTATLSTALCTRDDIMLYLINKGMEARPAFFIMESVRKGRGITPEMEGQMDDVDVPAWFKASCKKIGYMFPRAHAAAYVMMAVRIAWYKVHRPLDFYSAYFTIRADNFSCEYVRDGREGLLRGMAKLEALGDTATSQQKDMLTYLEVALEMYARGFSFLGIDLQKSHATEYLIEGNNLRLPFVSAEGMGLTAAGKLYEQAQLAPFISVEDIKQRCGISSAILDKLSAFGCLTGLSLTNQISLF